MNQRRLNIWAQGNRRVTGALLSLALCFVVGSWAPRAIAAAMNVDALAEAGASLEFRPFEASILSLEPLAGHLVLRNSGGQPLEYKSALLTGSSIVMKVIQDDGGVVEVPLRDASIREGPVRLNVLAPGEEELRVLIFPTADSPLETPGVYRAVLVLTDNGLLQTPEFLVTVTAPAGEDLAVLAGMRALYSDSKNPISFLEHGAMNPSQEHLDNIAAIVRAHPTSRYAAMIAKDLMDYMGVLVAPALYPDTEHYLGIAASHGSRAVSENARYDLAKIALAAGRYVDARQHLTGLETAVDSHIQSAAANLMQRLENTEAGWIDISPEAMARMAALEATNIRDVITAAATRAPAS